MEVKNETDCCRLCFSQNLEYIKIYENEAMTPNIVNALKKYFHDEVSFYTKNFFF